MRPSDSTNLRRPALLAIAGAGLLLLGFAAGRITQSAPAPPPAPANPSQARVAPPTSTPPEIAAQLTALQSQVQRLHRDLLAGRATSGPSGSGDAEASGRIAIDPPASSGDLLPRLQRIEALQRQILTMNTPTMAIPPGVGVVDFFIALKEGDSDRVTEAHHLWTYADVQATYGPPDDVIDQEDYIEWVYRLPEEDQFDFHFVNGLCVLAH